MGGVCSLSSGGVPSRLSGGGCCASLTSDGPQSALWTGKRYRRDAGSHGPLRGPRRLPLFCVHIPTADGSAQVPVVPGPLARAGGTYTPCRGWRHPDPRPRVRRSAPPDGPEEQARELREERVGRAGVSARLTSSSQDGQASLGTRIV